MSHSRFPAISTRRTRVTACLLSSVATLALLSACGSRPQISAQLESTQYLSHARRNYAPPGPASDPWGPYISEASAKFDVPERWIREVMHQESGGRLYGHGGDLITSGAGAMGLMQVMPGTYDELKARYTELGSDPFDPHNNILAGTAYLREMYDIYGSPGFLAAYNAGPGRLDDYLTRSRTLPEETRRYVASIGPKIAGAFPNARSPGEQYAMNALPLQIPDGVRYPGSGAASGTEVAGYSSAVALALDPVPASPPIVLTPAASVTSAAPATPTAQLAQLPPPRAEARGEYITLSPQPLEIVQLPEPLPIEAQGSTVTAAPRPVQPFARLPEPPAYLQQTPPAERARPTEPTRQFAALAPAVLPRRPTFSLVSPANAAPVVIRHGGFAPGNWAVQVGAFGNANLASAATAAARDTARDVLGSARPAVSSVRQPRGTLYRARLVGLSRDAAAHACERLVRIRTNCMIVSPDAQS